MKSRKEVMFTKCAWAASALLLPMVTAGAAAAQSTTAPAYIRTDSPITYTELENPTVLWTTGDDYDETIQLPFTFDLYGEPFTEVEVSTNGALRFGQGYISYSNEAPGASPGLSGFIAPFWDDLSLEGRTDTLVGYEIAGQAPRRTVTIEFRDVSLLGTPSSQINFMVRLFEGPGGRIEIDYGTSRGTSSASATMGMESPDNDRPLFFAASACTTLCAQSDLDALENTRISLVQSVPGVALSGTFLDWPNGAFPGSSVTGSIELVNTGTLAASGVIAEVYLSADDIFDANDTLVGQTTQDLASLAAIEAPITADIPSDVASGSYRLIMVIDPDDSYAEANRADNIVVGPTFMTTHELTPLSVEIDNPRPLTTGNRLNLTLRIGNYGVPRASNLLVQIYASLDGTYGPEDLLLGGPTVRLEGETEEEVSVRVTMPDVPAGRYNLVLVLDPRNAVDEADETNNTLVSSAAISVGPDLTASGNVSLPFGLSPGDTTPVVVVLQNEGAEFLDAFGYALYLSTDNQLDGQDIPLGQFTTAIPADGSIEARVDVTVPATVQPGYYYIITAVDPAHAVAESNEGNNVVPSTEAIVVGRDFGFVEGSGTLTPNSFEAGDPLELEVTILTPGGGFHGDLGVEVYFSLDDTLDPSDARIALAQTTLSGAAETPMTIEFLAPTTVPPGVYQVFVVIDPDNHVPEVDESNNSVLLELPARLLGADLYIREVTGSDYAFIGLPYEAQAVIENSGVAAARGFRYAYYLSNNDICRTTDREVFVSEETTLEAGEERVLSDAILMPTFTSSTAQWLCLFADIRSQVPESSETNNIRARVDPIAVIWPVPDLTGAILDAGPLAAAGEDLEIRRVVQNVGVADAASFQYVYVLSADSIIDAEDPVVGRFSVALGTGEDDYRLEHITLPPDLPAGSYYLGLLLDSGSAVAEVTKANNAIVGPRLDVFGSDVRFADIELPNGTLGVPYEAAVSATGGAFASRYTLQEGALPAGLSLSETTGLLAGTPETEGLFDFTIRAQAGTGYADLHAAIRILAPSIELRVVTTVMASAVVGQAYRSELLALGGVAPYRWTTAQDLPPGLVLESGGTVSGTPLQRLHSVLTFDVTDDVGNRVTADVAFNISSADQLLQIISDELSPGTIAIDYEATNPLRAVAGDTDCTLCTWSIIGAPPPGMRLAADGFLVGTPEKVGRFPFIARAQDESGLFDTAQFVFVVDGGTDLAISTTELDAAKVGEPYEAKVNVIRGRAPYAFDIVEAWGGTLPPGIVFQDGVFSGTPTEPGLFAFTVRVTDGDLRADVQPMSIEVIGLDAPHVVDDGGCSCSTAPAKASGSSTGSLVGLGAMLLFLALTRSSRQRNLRRAMAHPSSRAFVRSALMVLVSTLGATAGATRQAYAQSSTLIPGTPYVMRVERATYQPLANPTVLWDDIDDGSQSVPMPFAFRFYDGEQTTMAVSANGSVVFPNTQSTSNGNATPGQSSSSGAFIAPFWDDLRLTDGIIGYEVLGAAPNRILAVEFRNIGRYTGFSGPSVGTRVSFQVRLFEGRAGRIEIIYGDVVQPGDPFDATMGMQDAEGTRGIQFHTPACNAQCSTDDFEDLSGSKVTVIQDAGVEILASAITAPALAFLKAPTPITVVVQSLHGEQIGPFDVSLEASRSKSFDAPILLGSTAVTLAPFERRSMELTVFPPASLGVGLAYFGLRVDREQQIEESDETNNLLVAREPTRILEGAPDIAVRTVTTQRTTAVGGETLTAYATLENVGGEAATGAEAALMLSTNPVISAQDYELGRFPVDLRTGQSTTSTLTVTVPPDINPGLYYIGVLADPENAMAELDENNNARPIDQPVEITSTRLTVLTEQLPAAKIGEPYETMVTWSGSHDGPRLQILTGSLPEGLELDSASGRVFGTPARVEVQNFRLSLQSGTLSTEKDLTMRVVDPEDPLTILNRGLPSTTVGREYFVELLAVGAAATATVTWSAADLPDGLRVERAPSASLRGAGMIAGTAEAEGEFIVEITVDDGTASTTRSFTLRVVANENLSIIPAPLSTATYGRPYRETLRAEGGLPPITWRVAPEGKLPEGVTLSSDGVLEGTPLQVGSFRLAVIAEDAAAGDVRGVDHNTFEFITLNEEPNDSAFRIETTELPPIIIGEPYEASIIAEGGTQPYEWTIIEGRVPEGLLPIPNPVTGALEIKSTGKGPSQPGTTNILVGLRDGRARETARAFVIRILEEAPPAGVPGDNKDDEGGCGCQNVDPSREQDASTPLIAIGSLFLIALARPRPRRRR